VGQYFTRLRWAPLTLDPGPREGWFLYSDSLNYLRDTDEVSDSDKAAIFAWTIRRLLRWPETPWEPLYAEAVGISEQSYKVEQGTRSSVRP
jgi:hypothetical protein